jgi:hypothetical protein
MLHNRTSVNSFSNWILNQIVQDAPDDSALCAFDCRRVQCTQDEWAACDRRLQHAAGELMPQMQPIPRAAG